MPTNFWTWFWPSFWMAGWNNQELKAPTKQQKFPWLTAEQIKRLESLTSDPQEQQRLYQQTIQQLHSQNYNENRIATENEMTYKSLNTKDTQQRNYMQSNVRLEQLADLTKKKFWLNSSADTQSVINWLMQYAEDNWVWLDSLDAYLDHGDESFLYDLWLKEQTQKWQALWLQASIANQEDKWEWNDNLFWRLETKEYDKDAGFWSNAWTFLWNTLKSGVNVLSDVWNMIVNPLDTANNLAKTAVWWAMNLLWTDEYIENMEEWAMKDRYKSANETADAVWQFFTERYGGWDEILNTLFTDPVGVVSDVASIIEWWAWALRWVTKWAAKWAAKAWLKSTASTLEKVGDVAKTVSNTAWKYDPYAVAMRWEIKVPVKAISLTVDTAKKIPWAKTKMVEKLNEVLDKTYWLDELTKKDIQNNPYSAEVWQKAKTYIEANWLPERSSEVSKQLITDVADKVQETMKKQMDELGETWPYYKTLKDAGYSVDLSNLKAGLDDMLKEYWITVEDWKLNFSKTAIDGSEANNIQKIYNRVQSTDAPMSMTEYLERFRKTISDMVDYNTNNKDAVWRKLSDTPWDKVLKGIRNAANELAHEQVAPLKDLDSLFKKQVDLINEVTEWIVYKDSKKKWVIRDNINQIMKNLDEPNRRVLKARLEKVLPWIEEEVRAINMLPKLIDNYYKPSKMQQKLTAWAWWVIGSIWWLPWALAWAWIWYRLWNKIEKLKTERWNEIVSTTSKEWADKLADIEKRISNNEKISQDQARFLNEISDKLKEWKAVKEWEITRIIADIVSAEEWKELAAIDKGIKELETIWAKDEVKEFKQLREDMIWKMNEEADMSKANEEFIKEMEKAWQEWADQRLPEFKKRIYQLEQQEKRVGRVWKNKIWKTFEWKDYKKSQDIARSRAKDKLIEEIAEYYNVDQFEAMEIYDRIQKSTKADEVM